MRSTKKPSSNRISLVLDEDILKRIDQHVIRVQKLNPSVTYTRSHAIREGITALLSLPEKTHD
jgi:hypothetical protein